MVRPANRTMFLALAIIAAYPASADFETGQQAWDAGKVDEALSLWRSAADEDDRRMYCGLCDGSWLGGA